MNRRATWMIRKLRGDTRGSIAVEFALVAPVLMIVLAGVIDIGSVGYVRLSLQSRVMTAAEYALMQDTLKSQADAVELAENVSKLLQGGISETVAVIVNNAARVDWNGSGSKKSTGPGAAEAYYCIGSDGEIIWDTEVGEDASCPSGDVSGQYVQISATARHVSIFPGYAFSDGDTVRASAVLRLN